MTDVDNLLESYGRIVLSANKKLNLVSRRNVNKLLPDLIEESLIPLTMSQWRIDSPILDIGSGGGFPGIPIKISRLDVFVTLLDSNRKKVLFLRTAIRDLGLTGAEAIWMRCEEFANVSTNQGRFATITARGVGDFDLLVRSAAKLLKPGGELIVWLSSVPESNATCSQYFEFPQKICPQSGLILLNLRRNLATVSSK